MADIDTDAVGKSEAALREEEVLAFWKEHDVFEKTLEKGKSGKPFIFYEGPPTANGRPGVHHIESRSFKDAIPRYKTMRGYSVPRRAGWDTHGLPVELEVEKQLGFSGKQDIETYGIAEFNKKCRESVFNYINDWQKFSDRMGYWVDQARAYFTFDAPYMESVWSVFKKVADDGRLYKDYRVVPWCPKCGTALSSHELAQGYEEVKDLSLMVKFKLKNPEKIGLSGNVYVLAWTTTPWTLPGNIALAVGEDIDYIAAHALTRSEEGNVNVFEGDNEIYIVAKKQAETVLAHLSTPWSIDKKFKGKELTKLEYEPLYSFARVLAPESEKAKFDTAYQIYAADFVNTEDGTGIVHTAVMYGQDDFELGKKVGLPKVHLVQPDGTFMSGTGFLEGASVIEPETSVAILKDLQEKGLFFAKENYTHSYPHCWRSKNRLIYYARDSWYIRMTELKDELIKENQKVNWEPAHIRDGRMGEWLANVRDWAISRERYWGTPLPVWTSEDGSEQVVIGSVEELMTRTKRSSNAFFIMRHGEAAHNLAGVMSSDINDPSCLTEKGHEQVDAAAHALKKEKIDLIVHSPLVRTKETAERVADALGIARANVISSEYFHENLGGVFEGKPVDTWREYRDQVADALHDRFEGGESMLDIKRRMMEGLFDLDRRHEGKNILIVGHGLPLRVLQWSVELTPSEDLWPRWEREHDMDVASVHAVDFWPYPHNDDYELDLHRPYIDAVALVSDSGMALVRTPEVMDVWFDSGAMPFAEDHYPFDNKEWIDTKGYPADFISEAIDQTRGWFYTLLAVGVLMGKGTAYKNVICLGHLLDEKGQKMSKSKGNIIEPMKAMDRYGADTLRYWMYYVNQPGDSKNFDEKTVKEAARVLSWFENSVKFYQLAVPAEDKGNEQPIDFWMRTRMSETIARVTAALDAYDLYTATRTLATLVEDLSQWYVRRVRDRVREGDAAAITTLRDALQTVAVLMAPFAPFIAEWAYQAVREDSDPESVHLADWYEPGTIDQDLIENMASTRTLASLALRARQAAGIKVRQPLSALSIPGELPKEFAELLADEVNVKEIIMGQDALALQTELTPELVEEGTKREFDRAVAEARKTLGLSPRDKAHYVLAADGAFVVELPNGPERFNLVIDAA